MLMGRYEYALDVKSRTNFPSKFKVEMGECLYVTKWFENCLVVYGQEEWDKLDSKFEGLPVTKVRDLLRLLYGNVSQVVPDKQGRILLPQYLKDHAGITKDIVVIGARTYAEIWDKEKYEQNEKANDFSVVETKLEDLEF